MAPQPTGRGMPELPDVEVMRRYFDATALHQGIAHVKVCTKAVLAEATPARLARALRGRMFVRTRRHGKHLFAHLDDGRALGLHFGMTGRLAYYASSEPAPKHARVIIAFHNGYHVAYVSQRKIGRVRLIEDVDTFIKSRGLGPDAYDPEFDADGLRALLETRRGALKPTLMNQSVVAGLGNVYVDEILWQARLNPRGPAAGLQPEEVRRLYGRMRRVLALAIERKADVERYPASWLTPHREAGGRCPRCHRAFARARIGGRTTYLCRKCQRS